MYSVISTTFYLHISGVGMKSIVKILSGPVIHRQHHGSRVHLIPNWVHAHPFCGALAALDYNFFLSVSSWEETIRISPSEMQARKSSDFSLSQIQLVIDGVGFRTHVSQWWWQREVSTLFLKNYNSSEIYVFFSLLELHQVMCCVDIVTVIMKCFPFLTIYAHLPLTLMRGPSRQLFNRNSGFTFAWNLGWKNCVEKGIHALYVLP